MTKQSKIKQERKVKRLLTDKEKDLVRLVANIIVTNTINKAGTETNMKYKNDT